MKDSIVLLRTLNLYYHHLHNVACGCSFAADHDMLAKLYVQLDAEYDMLVERFIGIGNELTRDIAVDILKESSEFMMNMPDSMGSVDMVAHFNFALQLESYLCSSLSNMENHSEGTKNLLQDLCDKSEGRQYLLKRRTLV